MEWRHAPGCAHLAYASSRSLRRRPADSRHVTGEDTVAVNASAVLHIKRAFGAYVPLIAAISPGSHTDSAQRATRFQWMLCLIIEGLEAQPPRELAQDPSLGELQPGAISKADWLAGLITGLQVMPES